MFGSPLVRRKVQKGLVKLFHSICSVYIVLNFQTRNYREKECFYCIYHLTVGNMKKMLPFFFLFIFIFVFGTKAKCYLNKTNMLKMVSMLSDSLTNPTDYTLSHTGINLRENVSTFLVKTQYFLCKYRFVLTKASFNNINSDKLMELTVLTWFSIWDKYPLMCSW